MPKKALTRLWTGSFSEAKSPLKTHAMQPPVLKAKDSSVTATRGLDIFVFNIQQIEGAQLTSHKQSIDFIKELGFHTIPTYKRLETLKTLFLKSTE